MQEWGLYWRVSDSEELVGVAHRRRLDWFLVLPKALISWDSVSGIKPHLKEMFGQTLICGANPPTPSVSCFSLLKNLTLSVVPKARMAIEYSSP